MLHDWWIITFTRSISEIWCGISRKQYDSRYWLGQRSAKLFNTECRAIWDDPSRWSVCIMIGRSGAVQNLTDSLIRLSRDDVIWLKYLKAIQNSLALHISVSMVQAYHLSLLQGYLTADDRLLDLEKGMGNCPLSKWLLAKNHEQFAFLLHDNFESLQAKLIACSIYSRYWIHYLSSISSLRTPIGKTHAACGKRKLNHVKLTIE